MNKKVNCLDQTAYIRRYTLTDSGIKVVEIYNGALRVMLNESKALDIMQLFEGGVNISFISKNGFGARENDFGKRFEGGMLYTCGLDSVGAREGFQTHGSLHNTPAHITRCECTENGITVEATLRDSELFGKNLLLKRVYTTGIGCARITLSDTLVNEGSRDEDYCILYHTNVGYPMLDEGTEIAADVERVTPRTKWAESNLDTVFKITEPEDNREETCYYLNLRQPKISVTNRKLGKRFTLEYSADTLPCFIEWKSMASGDYALGLEPTTTLLDGSFEYANLKAGQSVNFSLAITVARV